MQHERVRRWTLLFAACASLNLVSCRMPQGHRQATSIAPAGATTALATGPTTRRVLLPEHARGIASVYNVRAFGAVGDGVTLDHVSINRAIEAASAAGGGTVYLPAGTYLSYSIRLKSNITLYLDHGCTIVAAEAPPQGTPGGYDAASPNPAGRNYQDQGHSYWENSLIWGIGLENVAITGGGMIDGRGLGGAAGGGNRGGRGGGRGRGRGAATGPGADDSAFTDAPTSGPSTQQTFGRGGRGRGRGGRGGRGGGFGGTGNNQPPRAGTGDKAIALKLCRNVTLRDITMFRNGHFSILATGVDNLTIDNVKFDTNRDAIDIDACRNVRIANCTVNSPNDDGIVLKSSFALGEFRSCENVTITNCLVSGFEVGSVLDGTYKVLTREVPDRMGPTGRIKFGTESNGGFKNIAISNIVFDNCRGLALETVDGALIEDVSISNITMRNTSNSPIFLRLGARMRGPENTPIGKLRRVNISNIVVHNADARFASIISGIPDNPIEDIKLSNIRIEYKGGGTAEDAARVVPEYETDYPEPQRMGVMPAYGFFIRHVKGIEMNDITLTYLGNEQRPPFVLDDVQDAEFNNIEAQPATAAPTFILKNVRQFDAEDVQGVPDTKRETIVDEKL
jgi:polygalacturonase